MIKSLVEDLKKDIKYINNLYTQTNVQSLWGKRLRTRFENIDESFINELTNFRSSIQPISEFPNFKPSIFKFLIPYQLATINKLKKLFRKLDDEEKNFLGTCLKLNQVGNPNYIKYKNFKYNERWLSNLKNANFVFKNLVNKFDNTDIICDIGGGYGNFFYMLKKLGYMGKYILVDLPEQLVFAKYYLKTSLPELKINNLDDLKNHNKISLKNINNFDILLLEPETFLKINFDLSLITNFYSFGEMSEENFFQYINSDQYANAHYLYTINHTFSKPTYKTNINIIDYKLENFKKLYLQNNYFRKNTIHRSHLFTYKKIEVKGIFFEFLGKNKFK